MRTSAKAVQKVLSCTYLNKRRWMRIHLFFDVIVTTFVAVQLIKMSEFPMPVK